MNRPNIVLIMADDVSPDMLGVYQQPGAANTPNIDRLAAIGVTFKTAWATSMCAPSRVEIMTGRYANTTGVYRNDIWLGDSRKRVYSDNVAFSKILHDSGYATAIAGKWRAGLQQPQAEELAFDEYALWASSARIRDLPGSPTFNGLMEDAKTPSRYWHPGYIVNGKLLETKPDDYSLDIETDFIKGFMERSVGAGKPFLAYWPTVAPHLTLIGTPTTPMRGEIGVLGESSGAEEEAARFRALNEYMDQKIGEVMDTVEELGIADNTVILFSSDNGTAGTAKTRGVERGSHIAFVAAGKGIVRRGMTDELTDLSDILPTLVEFAGAEASVPEGAEFDGVSLVPFLTGKKDSHREWIYAYIAGTQLLRTKNYMLEVVNPILGLPRGRFYYTGDYHFGKGYLLADGNLDHQVKRRRFDQILGQLPALTREHEFFKTKRGKNMLKWYEKPKSMEEHLFSHEDYKFYDQTYRHK